MKYTPNSLSVSAILGLIASGDIAIPEIQGPIVWKKTFPFRFRRSDCGSEEGIGPVEGTEEGSAAADVCVRPVRADEKT